MEVTRKGEVMALEGIQKKVGESAPDFVLNNLDEQPIKLSDYRGKVVLLSIVPDIDTRVCALQTKYFNEEANGLPDVQLMTISNNTADEQRNWCATENVTMEMLHDTALTFGKAYGLYIPALNRLARGIYVIDRQGEIAYEEIVSEVSHEPDYIAALEAAMKVVAESH